MSPLNTLFSSSFLITLSLLLRHIDLHKMSTYAPPTHPLFTIPNPDVTRPQFQHRMRGLLFGANEDDLF